MNTKRMIMGAFLDSANDFLNGQMSKDEYLKDLVANLECASEEQLRRIAEAIQKDA